MAADPPRIANPIYREVVPRELGYVLQDSLDIQTRWYVDADGRLNMTKLLTAFGTFFGEHAEHWLAQLGAYREAAPQLILHRRRRDRLVCRARLTLTVALHDHPAVALAAALARCPEAVCRRYLPHGRREGRY